MMSSPEVMKFTGFRKPQSKETINELFFKWKIETSYDFGVWCVEEKDSKSCIGWFMLKITEHNAPELGFMIHKNHWGKGFATEVSRVFINHAFNDLKIEKIIASADRINTSSILVLKKIGMVEVTKPKEDDDILHFEVKKHSVK
jgi:ribosomal-protein-alanine N-acetyltransferase